jgi:hypothetical protein
VSVTIAHPYEGLFFGPTPPDLPRVMRDLKLDVAFIASPTEYKRVQYVTGVVPILFDDDDRLAPAKFVQITWAMQPWVERWRFDNLRVGCFCFAGLNRSAFLAGLWAYLTRGECGVEVVKRLRKSRGTPECLCNRQFAELLHGLAMPLLTPR